MGRESPWPRRSDDPQNQGMALPVPSSAWTSSQELLRTLPMPCATFSISCRAPGLDLELQHLPGMHRVSGAAQPLPAMLSSFTNITNNSRPYFPRVWISFPSSWHYCFLTEQFLPHLGSFLQCIQSCLDEMKMLDITREAQGSWIIQTPCKELGGR